MKCCWCTEPLRGSVFKFTALHVGPLGDEVTPTISTGEPLLSKIACSSCGEGAIEEAIALKEDEPPRMVPGGDVTYTCLACASDILDGELMVQVKEGLTDTVREGALDPVSEEVQGAICLRCARDLGAQMGDTDMDDLRALMCCHICSEHNCWREGDCRCSCHGNDDEETYDGPDTSVEDFDVLPF